MPIVNAQNKPAKKLMGALGGVRQHVIVGNDPDVKPDNARWPLHEYVGLEIETENFLNVGRATEELRQDWCTHVDMSLQDGTEWVTRIPVAGNTLSRAIDSFFAKPRNYTISERTSVHIHINMSDDITVDLFRSMLALVYIVEPAIFRIADENRKWCSYSCPLTDMSQARFTAMFTEQSMERLGAAFAGVKHEDKYYGFNAVSLRKHGTAEFRYFPCTQDKNQLESWIKLVMELKKAAIAYPDPAALLDLLQTADGISAFVRHAMPCSAEAILMYLDRDDAVERAVYLSALIDPLNKNNQRIPVNNPGSYTKLVKLLKPAVVAAKQQRADEKQAIGPAAAGVQADALRRQVVLNGWRDQLAATNDPARRKAIEELIAGIEAANR